MSHGRGVNISHNRRHSTPTASSELYAGPITIAGNGTQLTLRAIAVKSGISPQIYSDGHTAEGFAFSDSTIARCGFAGIQIVILQTGTSSAMSDLIVNGLAITESGRGWSGRRWNEEGRGVKVDAIVGSGTLSGVVIKGCSISGSIEEGIYIGGNAGRVVIEQIAVFNNEHDGIVESSTGTEIGLNISSSLIYNNAMDAASDDKAGVAYNVPSGTGCSFYHNTFYDNGVAGLVLWFHSGGLNIVNNLFHSSIGQHHLLAGSTLRSGAIKNNYFTEHESSPVIAVNVLATAAGYHVSSRL